MVCLHGLTPADYALPDLSIDRGEVSQVLLLAFLKYED